MPTYKLTLTVRKGKVGDKSYSLRVQLSKGEGVFEEFELVIGDKLIPITDPKFYKLRHIDYGTSELLIGRSSFATNSRLVFGPFESLEIKFNYYGPDTKKCAMYQAKYEIKLDANKGKLTTSCFKED